MFSYCFSFAISDLLPVSIIINRAENVDSAIWTKKLSLNVLQNDEAKKLPCAVALWIWNNVCIWTSFDIIPLFNNKEAIKDNYLSLLDKILGDC
jgi:hypothetical protein